MLIYIYTVCTYYATTLPNSNVLGGEPQTGTRDLGPGTPKPNPECGTQGLEQGGTRDLYGKKNDILVVEAGMEVGVLHLRIRSLPVVLSDCRNTL